MEGVQVSPTLPWDNFREWIHCIAVVTFDLELGQTLELVYPSHVKLSEDEKSNICYLSFPDSNSGCMGDSQFHFRIRHEGPRTRTHPATPPPLTVDQHFIFGYVYFRQVKDPSLRRGYFQKSVVILSKLQFVNLFNEILGILAPAYFDQGQKAIEIACQHIFQWSSPVPGQMLNLPFLRTVFQVLIPTLVNPRVNGSPIKCKVKSESSLPVSIIASVHEPDLFLYFRPVLTHINLLWELVLTSEPLVVMAPVPETVSSTVHALVSMIYPLRYCADFRPYFTIHDSDFKEVTRKNSPPPPVILGVTNPFFAKTLQHWPHILRIGDQNGASKVKKASNLKLIDSQSGVYTSYRGFLQKDKSLLSKVEKGVDFHRSGEVQTCILRRHLLELTESFMIPLERYIGSLMPLQKNICPAKAAPVPRPFKPDDFLSTLDQSGPQLTTGIKGEWAGLYRKFFRSINFSEWYNARYREAANKLQALHLEAIAETDVLDWVSGRDEVEAVDLILRLREQMALTHLPFTHCQTDVRGKLQTQVDLILATLPDDLQILLKSK